jgi:hypothetical protein
MCLLLTRLQCLFEARSCLRASSRDVVGACIIRTQFKERIAVSPRTKPSTVPLTFEALHWHMASARSPSPLSIAWLVVCERVCDRERVTHCLIETATSTGLRQVPFSPLSSMSPDKLEKIQKVTFQRTHRCQPPTKNLTVASTFDALPFHM